MKRLFFLCIVFFALHGVSYAQSSIFWQITKSNTKDTAYLYGSVHIQDKRVFALDPAVKRAFELSPNFVLEVELDKINPFAMAQLMMMHQGYDKLVSSNDVDVLKMYFSANDLGIDYQMANRIKPFFLYSVVLSKIIPNEMPDPLDLDFLKKARKAKKKVIGLETIEEQMATIDKISLEDQAKMLMEVIRNISTSKKEYDLMLDLYLKGDSEGLWLLSSDTSGTIAGTENFVQYFIIDRNTKMTNGIIKSMEEQKTFALVGAAHLGGEFGIVKQLQAQGYTLEPISVKFE